jgi:hypothetical protein
MEVDYEGDAHYYSHGKWSPPRGPDKGALLHSDSCPTSSFCGGVGKPNALTYLGNEKWSTPKPVDAKGILNSVSCPSTSLCIAVDLEGKAVTYGS